ncbi:hypothetical protein AWB71_05332 [Caballeronia peredens]|nr:hypothetical protein AWB71_05332 [Caballeronia peredens]
MIFSWNKPKLTIDDVLSRVILQGQSVHYYDMKGDSHYLGSLQPEQYKFSQDVINDFTKQFLVATIHTNQSLSELYLQPHDELKKNITKWCNGTQWDAKEERTSLFVSPAFEDALRKENTAYFASFESDPQKWPKEIQHIDEKLISEKLFGMEYDKDENIWECYIDSSDTFENELVASVRHSLVKHFWHGENYPVSLDKIDYSLVSNRDLIKELARAATETDLERDLFRTIPVDFVYKHHDCFNPGSVANSLGLAKDEDYTDALQHLYELSQLKRKLETNLSTPSTKDKPKLKI